MLGDLGERVVGASEWAGMPWHHCMAGILASPVAAQARCYKHATFCAPHASDVEVAGPTCTDFSPEGLRQGLAGPSMPAFWAWARLLRANPLLKLAVFENVPEFPLWLLEQVFGDTFGVYPFLIGPEDVGFSLVRRDRIYVLLVHTARAVLWDCPEQLLERLRSAGRAVATRPRDALLATPAEVHAEALSRWARRVRRGEAHAWAPPILSGGPAGPRVNPEAVLTGRELAAVSWCDTECWQTQRVPPNTIPDLFYFLGDNPWARRCYSSAPVLPTFRTNAGLFWSPHAGRWLTCRERLACMGYPVYPCLARAAGTEVWDAPPGVPLAVLAGNAMHVGAVSLALLVGLACTRPKDARQW